MVIRLEKHLAETGIMSRREAKEAIAEGHVLINGKVIRIPGTPVDTSRDRITFTPFLQRHLASKETVIMYKPLRCATTRESQGTTIYTSTPKINHLACVDHLDAESEGLIVLTNDGSVARVFSHERSLLEREYVVKTRETISPKCIREFEQGLVLGSITTLPAQITRIDRNTLTIVVKENISHQVRRCIGELGLTMVSLLRTRIGFLELESLHPGQFRKLGHQDVEKLKQLSI